MVTSGRGRMESSTETLNGGPRSAGELGNWIRLDQARATVEDEIDGRMRLRVQVRRATQRVGGDVDDGQNERSRRKGTGGREVWGRGPGGSFVDVWRPRPAGLRRVVAGGLFW